MNTHLDALVDAARATAADLIVEILSPSPHKRRFIFQDRSFLDIYLSQSQKNVYAFHYERRHIDGTLWRVDNYPHHAALHLPGAPHHLHSKRDHTVIASAFGNEPQEILLNFLWWIRTQTLSNDD